MPMPHYTDRLSFARSRGSYFRVVGLRGWEPPSLPPPRARSASLPVPHRTAAAAIGGKIPSASPIYLPPPPTLLLFRVISTFRYALRKRDFKTVRRSIARRSGKALPITGFDFACNLQRCNYIRSQIFGYAPRCYLIIHPASQK